MNWKTIEKYLFGRVARNIYFWLLFTLFHYSGRGNAYYLYPVLLFVLVISYAGPCYINNLFLIPNFLLKRKYVSFFILFLILLIFTSTISYYVTQWSNKTFPGLNYMGTSKNVSLPNHAFPSLFMLIIFAASKFTIDAFENRRRLEQLESQQVLSELESLKSQINPHFLFNSLNTVYGLARRKDDESAEAIMKLSEILRYILYECNVSLISLEKEIAFLNNYLEFAKLRNDDPKISFEISDENPEQQIAPLILLPFIENAIKHGLGRHIQKAWVKVKIRVYENHFYFECANSNYNKKKFTGKKENSSGIGLKNVKRRLNLIYGDKHKLDIEDTEDRFQVLLIIQLK